MELNYKAWIKAAEERLAVIEQQRKALDAEASALKQSIESFKRLPEIPSREGSAMRGHPAYLPHTAGEWIHSNRFADADLGLTDAIRAALIAKADSFMTPTEIRDVIVIMGFNFGDRPNPMANVHQVLRRLVDQEEVEPMDMGGKTAYRWKARNMIIKPAPASLKITGGVNKLTPPSGYKGKK
jgi:hypothetical protein